MARKKRTRGVRRAGGERLDRSAKPQPAVEQSGPHIGTSPALTGGDTDADWRRAAQVGEEAVGGTVATPDQNVVDDLGKALGVPQAPEAEFRPSAEILEERDRQRWEQEP